MAFIDRVVGPDEKLIGILSVHWIYAFRGFLWFLVFAGTGKFLDYQIANLVYNNPGLQTNQGLMIAGDYIFYIGCAIGSILFLLFVVMYLTTELGLTTQRVIYKRGLLMVDVKESDLEEIKAADVDNGVLGRILNYGYINFDARFVENVTLPAIADPYRFVKALNEARTNLRNGDISQVINNRPQGQGNAPQQDQSINVTHDIQEERYKSMEDSPSEAIENMFTDTPPRQAGGAQEKLRKDVGAIKNVMRKKQEPEPASEPKIQVDAKDVSFPSSRPIIFKRNVKKRKDELARRVRSAFARKSQA